MSAELSIPAVLLAGGAGSRLSGAKAHTMLAGRPLIARTAARLGPRRLAVAGDDAAARLLGADALPDALPGRAGPLAGVLAALRWHAGRVLTVPCDMPFLPEDLVARLAAAPAAAIAVPAAGGRTQHGVALWPAGGAALVEAVLAAGGRALRDPRLMARWHVVDFGAATAAFADIDTPADLAEAERRLAPP